MSLLPAVGLLISVGAIAAQGAINSGATVDDRQICAVKGSKKPIFFFELHLKNGEGYAELARVEGIDVPGVPIKFENPYLSLGAVPPRADGTSHPRDGFLWISAQTTEGSKKFKFNAGAEVQDGVLGPYLLHYMPDGDKVGIQTVCVSDTSRLDRAK